MVPNDLTLYCDCGNELYIWTNMDGKFIVDVCGLCVERAFEDGLEEGSDSGWDNGYNEGYREGQAERSQHDYDDGYEAGLTDGYENGRSECADES